MKVIHIEQVYKSVQGSDLDIRKDLYQNIVLSGGTTMFEGIVERLNDEVSKLAPRNARSRVNAPAGRKFSVWLGGSILSSLSTFQGMWITKILKLKVRITKEEENNDEGYPYKFLMKNNADNRISQGIVHLGEKLEEEEFISYDDDFGNSFLISNFETEEYQCTGSCYCEEDERRTGASTSVPLRTGLVYLVAAASSFMAMEKAKNYFQAECDDKCEDERASWIVDDCSSVDVKKVLSELDPTGPEITKRFQCTGKCMPTLFTDRQKSVEAEFLRKGATDSMIQTQLELYAKNALQFRCERLHSAGVVTKKFDNDGQVAIKLVFYENPDDGYRQNIQYDFTHNFLNPYCLKNSMKKVKYISKALRGVAGFEFKGIEKQLGGAVVPMCAGHLYGNNPSIQCVEVKADTK